MTKCKYEGDGVWAGRCIGTREIDPCPGYDKCERYKPDAKTNSDWLRSLSDSDLAMWIANRLTDYHLATENITITATEKIALVEGVYKTILYWLRQLHEVNCYENLGR